MLASHPAQMMNHKTHSKGIFRFNQTQNCSSARFVARAQIPTFLAGGLKPGNVTEAIRQVRPDGVDICSGVRRNGKLDQTLLNAFVQAIRSVSQNALP